MKKIPPCKQNESRNLTDNEVIVIVSGLLGGLLRVTNVETLKRVMKWWAETPGAWTALDEMQEDVDKGILQKP